MSQPADQAEPGLRGAQSGPLLEWAGVAWFTLLFVLSIGVTNGDTPQNSYLLYGLRLADPQFLPGDWFTWQTVHSHPAFARIVQTLTSFGSIPAGLTVGLVLQNAAFPPLFYLILRRLHANPLLPWAAALAFFAAVDTTSVGSEPWLKSFLGVSSLAGVAMVVALVFLLRRGLIGAGVAFGAAALIHAHFFFLSIPLLLVGSIVIVLDSRDGWPRRRLALSWVAFLLVALPSVVQIVRFATAPGAEEIHWLTASVFPYHIDPSTWNRDTILLLLGAVLFGIGGVLLRPPRWDRMAVVLIATLGALVFVPLILAYPGWLDLAAQAWPWRLSPLLLVACLAAGMAALIPFHRSAPSSEAARDVAAGSLLVGVVVIAGLSRPPVSYVLLVLVAAPLALGISRWWCRRWNWSPALVSLAVGAVITCAYAPLILRAADRSHFEFRAERPSRENLYAWARDEVPADAIFAIPPTWEKFRTIARRPVVVDWKAVPRYPPDRIEWLERIRAVTGVERPGADGSVLDAGYARMDCDLARRLREEYGARFVVHDRPKELGCGRLVYEDAEHRIWDLDSSAETTR